MTLVLGWNLGEYAFLVADSAVSSCTPPSTSISTFGEHQSLTENGYVEESLIKIIPLGDGVAIGISGDVRRARQIVEFLKGALALGIEINDALSRISSSLGPFSSSESVEVLLANSYPGKPAELFRWTTTSGKADRTEASCIGSAPAGIVDLLELILNKIRGSGIPATQALTAIVAFAQSLSISESMIEHGIGGAHYGLGSKNGHIFWQSDLHYIVYGKDLTHIKFVSVKIRNNAVISHSGFNNSTTILADTASCEPLSGNLQSWIQRIALESRSRMPASWIFIPILGRHITIVEKRGSSRSGKLLTWSPALGQVSIVKTLQNRLLSNLIPGIESVTELSMVFEID